jgi:hypothetical protein
MFVLYGGSVTQEAKDVTVAPRGAGSGVRGGSAMTATPSNADVQQAGFGALAKQLLMSSSV